MRADLERLKLLVRQLDFELDRAERAGGATQAEVDFWRKRIHDAELELDTIACAVADQTEAKAAARKGLA